jgi:hypothetical protein
MERNEGKVEKGSSPCPGSLRGRPQGVRVALASRRPSPSPSPHGLSFSDVNYSDAVLCWF